MADRLLPHSSSSVEDPREHGVIWQVTEPDGDRPGGEASVLSVRERGPPASSVPERQTARGISSLRGSGQHSRLRADAPDANKATCSHCREK